MNKKLIAFVGLSVWATGMTILVIRTHRDVIFLADALHTLLRHLEQKQVDEMFSSIIDNMDEDPHDS